MISRRYCLTFWVDRSAASCRFGKMNIFGEGGRGTKFSFEHNFFFFLREGVCVCEGGEGGHPLSMEPNAGLDLTTLRS